MKVLTLELLNSHTLNQKSKVDLTMLIGLQRDVSRKVQKMRFISLWASVQGSLRKIKIITQRRQQRLTSRSLHTPLTVVTSPGMSL